MRALSLIVGILLTLWTLMAIVRAMLIPRGSNSVIERIVIVIVNAIAFAPLRLMRTYERQDKWLAAVGPVSILLQLVVYVVILIFTTGLIVYGCTDLSLMNSLYQSGATLTTLGIVEPINVASAITTFVAAFLGLVVIAIFIGYLLALYSALVARESQMAQLSLLAGEPAWGPQIIARGFDLGLPTHSAPDAAAWIPWVCDLRMNLRINPVLAEFRSTGEYRHWLTSLLAVMDACALRAAFDPSNADPVGLQLITEGSITLSLMNNADNQEHNWQLQTSIRRALTDGRPDSSPSRLSDEQWQAGVDALTAVGYPLPDDMSAARAVFGHIRQTYQDHAYTLARRLHAVPAPWSGPRLPTLDVIWPELAQRGVAT